MTLKSLRRSGSLGKSSTNLAGKDVWLSSNPSPCSEQGQLQSQFRLLGDMSAEFGTSPRMETTPPLWSTVAQPSLCKVFSVCLVSVFPSSSCSCCLLCVCHAPLKKTMLFRLLYNPSSSSRTTSSLSLFSRLNKPGPLGLSFLYCYFAVE